jgi:hypothetical protein
MCNGINACGKNAVLGKVITGTSSGSVISISIGLILLVVAPNSTVSNEVPFALRLTHECAKLAWFSEDSGFLR